MKRIQYLWALSGAMLLFGNLCVAQIPSTLKLDIQPQSIDAALNEFARQSGLQVVLQTEEVRGIVSRRLVGTFTAQAALQRLLSDTGLSFEYLNERTVAVRSRAGAADGEANRSGALEDRRPSLAQMRVARVDVDPQSEEEQVRRNEHEKRASSGDAKGIPEILVRDRRSSNVDIRRTEDDVQPYVVFDAEEIERSMAPDLETFLKTRLPMNQVSRTLSQQNSSFTASQSTIDLRGLGADQTLVLVNGRRMPEVQLLLGLTQPDINGIPLASIERIEILPSTAGGIYGGGATGGVVNIILKRSYGGLQVDATYDGTFKGGGARRQLQASGGFSLENGKTDIMVLASVQDSNPLYGADRDFYVRSVALNLKTHPSGFYDDFTGFWGLEGYTTNIWSTSGNPLVLASNGQSLGSSVTHVPVGYAGPDSDNGAGLVFAAGSFNTDLPNDARGRQSMISMPKVRSASVSVRREFTGWLEAFVDLSRYENVGTSYLYSPKYYTLPPGPANPFTEEIDINLPQPGLDAGEMQWETESNTDQIAGGLVLRLPGTWTAQAEYARSTSQTYSNHINPYYTPAFEQDVLNGTLNVFRDVNQYPLNQADYFATSLRTVDDYGIELKNATLRLAGPVWRLPTGPIVVSALLERREQYSEARVYESFNLNAGQLAYGYRPPIGSSTDSAYAEITAPLVSAANGRRGLRSLDVQLSIRYDDTTTETVRLPDRDVQIPSPDGPFPDVSTQTNSVTANQYTLGMSYMPATTLALRTSFGRGILPPNPYDLSEFPVNPAFIPLFLNVLPVFDPKRGGERIISVDRMSFSGGNLNLREEISDSWSAGMIWTPEILPGLRVSLDYTRIEKTDEIARLTGNQLYLDLEDRLKGNIVREPLTQADEALGYTGGRITGLNFSYTNIAKSLVEAYDVQVDYEWRTRLGAFTASVLGSFQPTLSQQVIDSVPETNAVGYSSGPLKVRGNTGLTWSSGPWSLSWNMQYYDAYRIYTATDSASVALTKTLNQGSPRVPSQTYHDVFGRYSFGENPLFGRGMLSNTEIRVSIHNVLNDLPPIIAAAVEDFGPRSGYSVYGDPRLRRYSIGIRKQF